MTNEKKPIYFVLMLINLLLMSISIIGSLYLLFSKDVELMFKIISLINSAAIVLSCIYLVKGTSKSASIYYKLFVTLFSITGLLLIGEVGDVKVFLYLNAISFASILVLGLAKDLGKFKSMIFCLIIVAIRLSDAIKNIIDFINSANPVAVISISGLSLALVLTLSVYAKYADKEARNKN